MTFFSEHIAINSGYLKANFKEFQITQSEQRAIIVSKHRDGKTNVPISSLLTGRNDRSKGQDKRKHTYITGT